MIRNISGVVKAAASLSLAGGILAAAALPAAAASPNDAYGLSATGPVAVSPIAEATYPGTSPVTMANVNKANLLTIGIVRDEANATSASSTLTSTSVTLSALVHMAARVIRSTCSLDPNTGQVTGTTTIIGGLLSARVSTPLAGNPGVNIPVSIPGVADIVLNRQSTAPDGTLTVDAVYITLLGSSQTITLAESTCNAASVAPVPILPAKTLAFSVGGLGLLLIGGLGYQLSRRRRATTAAL